MRHPRLLLSLLLPVAPLWAATSPKPMPGTIDVAGFSDSRHHWRNIIQPERFMQATGPDQPAYGPEQAREIADNILLFQRENGGWPKDYDMLAVLTEAQKKLVRDTRANTDTSYDNHNTHPQVAYLARAFVALGDPALRAACERGLDFMLASQYANGGFPQWWPKGGTIAKRITLNDGVMIGILNVLKDAADRAPHWTWLDEARRARCAEAVARGTACLLKMQIPGSDGAPTGWGQQHDEVTLATVGARTFELPCVAPADTTEVVQFLMRFEPPAPEIVAAVEAAVAWLKKVRLDGIRVQRVPAPRAEFARHKTDFDVVVIKDESAPPLWARTVEPGTDRPIFASRDGVKVYSLAEVDRERRTGSGWYVTNPGKLLETYYPAWRKRVASK
ncbi:MAG: pectate lyase [Opitutaceae bacterium]|nr:pectate lyase [Opitutaceae bacterium]